LAAILPSLYKVFVVHSGAVFSLGGFFALGAATVHAIWVVMGRVVQQDTQNGSAAGRTLYMFLIGALLLIIASNIEAVHVVEAAIRGVRFQPRYAEYAGLFDHLNLFFTGLLAAASVLLLIHALTFDTPINIAAYQYTVPIWATMITVFLPQRDAENSPVVLLIMVLASSAIAVSAFWLHKLQMR
jgi:hypothetical protein